jgi:hypothetical protein
MPNPIPNSTTHANSTQLAAHATNSTGIVMGQITSNGKQSTL